MGPHLGRIEMVHGNRAMRQLFQFAQHLPFAVAQDLLGNCLADPIVAMHALHGAGAHGAVELAFGGFRLDRLGKGHFQEAGGIVRVA